MIICTKCKREIPPADFNVSTDIAFCRNCNTTHKFSELGTMVNARGFDSSIWPKHLRYTSIGSEEILVYHKVSPILLFLVPFTLLWSGGSMTGIYIKPILENRLNLFEALFGLPFLAGTLVLLSVIVFLMFGSFRLVLNGPDSYLGWGVMGFIKKRHFDAGQIASVHLAESSYRSNRQVQKEIILKLSDGAEIKFGAMIADDCKIRLAEFLAARKGA